MATKVTGNPDKTTFFENATNPQENKREDLSKSLGDLFQKYISVDQFLAFRQVQAEALGLDPSAKTLKGVNPDVLQDDNVVAGISKTCPFIVARIELLDKNSEKSCQNRPSCS